MLRMTVYAILLIVITLPAWGLTEARLLNQSTSGQTVVFNLGIHDGVNSGDYAVIVKQIRSLDDRDLRLVPVAKARNVKINSDSSVWILYKIYDQELLIKGDKFSVLSESHMLSGRRPPQLGRITLVTDKNKIKEQITDAENDDKHRLGKLDDKYEVMTPAHENHAKTDTDADLIDVEQWKKNKDSRYRSSVYKSADKEEFRRQLRLTTFEKLVTAYLQRVNDPDFNYDTFYEKQRKSGFANEFSVNGSYGSEYSRFLREESVKTSADAKLFRSILEKGESWSEDYSDEELRKTLNYVSVLQEKDRRLMVISKPTRFTLALEYGFTMNDAQTEDDAQYHRDSLYSTEIDFEVTPFLRHEALERFTVDATFRLNYTAFAADAFNADLNEYSLSLGANWYPVYASYVVEAPIFYLGTYLRSGFANANAPTPNEQANYTVLSLPGFRAGFKYLLRNRVGIRLQASMETLKIERYEASKTNSVLPENANLVETKVGVGLAYAF
jgi:hypothetical protein